jgi:hypothetical protein
MKTTQDVSILLNQIASKLEYDLASITIYTDKSFQIDAYSSDTSKVIYNSDEALDRLDINDVCYYDVSQWVEMIKVFSQPEDATETVSKSLAERIAERKNLNQTQLKAGDKFENL